MRRIKDQFLYGFYDFFHGVSIFPVNNLKFRVMKSNEIMRCDYNHPHAFEKYKAIFSELTEK